MINQKEKTLIWAEASYTVSNLVLKQNKELLELILLADKEDSMFVIEKIGILIADSQEKLLEAQKETLDIINKLRKELSEEK